MVPLATAQTTGMGTAGGVGMMPDDKDSKRVKTKFEELCNEDKILVFFKRLINEWNQELDEMTKLEKERWPWHMSHFTWAEIRKVITNYENSKTSNMKMNSGQIINLLQNKCK